MILGHFMLSACTTNAGEKGLLTDHYKKYSWEIIGKLRANTKDEWRIHAINYNKKETKRIFAHNYLINLFFNVWKTQSYFSWTLPMMMWVNA